MLATIKSCGIIGIDGYIVDVETDIGRGLPSFEIVGLPNAAVKESKERIRAAIRNSGLEMPARRTTINLAPANIKKVGASYDLPMAVGILAASEQLSDIDLSDALFIGELSLNGDIRPANGVLPMTDCAKRNGIKRIFVPLENAVEAAVVDGITVYAPKSLTELLLHLTGKQPLTPVTCRIEDYFNSNASYPFDFADVRGQENAKYALEIAAAGGHNCLMVGPPGAGKTMLAQRLPTILPDMSLEEAIEVTKIHSIAGELPADTPLIVTRPFRHPHHTVSAIRLVGGGSIPMPGELSLAHNGVLFLDEFPEFEKRAIEVMRQPLEDGMITVSRVSQSASFPCNAMLIASMNPCRCGHYNDPNKECTCSPAQVQQYMSRISGPMLDRIDIQVHVAAVKFSELRDSQVSEPSEKIRERVNRARRIQHNRYRDEGIYSNSQLTAPMVSKYCRLTRTSESLLKAAFNQFGMSARGYTRVLKLARTIADLQGDEEIRDDYLMQAISYRSLDRQRP